jgi:UDP-3-O-[3-hydroxymyristoyl] glucosamine N-acyltransferase
VKLGDLAAWLNVPLIGDALFEVFSVGALETADETTLCYVQDESYVSVADSSQCGVLIISPLVHSLLANSCANFLIADNPQLMFVRAAEKIHPVKLRQGLHPTASVDPTATIAESAWIGAYTVIEAEVHIGCGVQIGAHCYVGESSRILDGTSLSPHVTVLHRVLIGRRCRVFSGAVIGADGFGLVQDQGAWIRVPHFGRVVIGDDVDIGANTTIDRGTLSDTKIMDGVKIDNLVQVAHNVSIGKHSAIAGCAGLAGSSVVGEHCLFAGGVGLAGHLELANGVHVTGMSMVTRSIHKAGVYSSGTPLDENVHWRRNAARFKSLDAMSRRLSLLERRIGIDEVLEEG